jgi:DNA-binding MarR family transcriptional regulator
MANIATTNNSRGESARRARASLRAVGSHVPESLLTYRISVLSQLLSRLVDTAVRQDLDLSSRQWRVLVMLNRLGKSTSGDVARLAHFDHSQVSRVSMELVQRGLIDQTPDDNDRRKQWLRLTPAGLEVLRDGVPGSLAREQRLRARLTEQQYEALCVTLDQLSNEAQRMLEEQRS